MLPAHAYASKLPDEAGAASRDHSPVTINDPRRHEAPAAGCQAAAAGGKGRRTGGRAAGTDHPLPDPQPCRQPFRLLSSSYCCAARSRRDCLSSWPRRACGSSASIVMTRPAPMSSRPSTVPVRVAHQRPALLRQMCQPGNRVSISATSSSQPDMAALLPRPTLAVPEPGRRRRCLHRTRLTGPESGDDRSGAIAGQRLTSVYKMM